MVKVKVQDMVIGKFYKVNDTTTSELTKKTEEGASGTNGQEPYFKLIFKNDEYMKDWDDEYEEVKPKPGGKRQRRTLRKSHSRKSYRRR